MLDILKKVAPWLITGLTGGVGGIAGMAASAIGSALGMSDSSVDAVKTALTGNSMTPEQMLALKQAENAFSIQMQQAGFTHAENMAGITVQQYKAEADDRDSARKLAAAQPKDWMRPLLGVGIVGATIAIVLMVLLGVADGTLRDPVIAATAGGLVMYFLKESSQVTGFYFGMTAEGSKQTAAITQFATSPDTIVSATPGPSTPAQAVRLTAGNATASVAPVEPPNPVYNGGS